MTDSKRKALIRVLGCKVNQAEAAAMARLLRGRGYEVLEEGESPDLVLVNTCCVTSRAEGKSRRLVKRLAEEFPYARIVVTGCLAEVNPGTLDGLSDRMTVLGTFEKDRLGEFLAEGPGGGVMRRGSAECTEYGDLGCSGLATRGRAFLKIQDGCSQGCSYCIVPRARGPSRSLAEGRVLEHARVLASQGYAEIVLTGVHLGYYGRDLDPAGSLEALLPRLLAKCPAVRFRLSSVEPQELTSGLIGLAAECPGICKHFHIPLQSGDDRVLAAMGRPYDRGYVAGLLGRLLKTIPDACIGLDVMVGFPGEDEAAFRSTEELIAGSQAAYLHVFPFSPRGGTRAALLRPRVPDADAKRRVERLRRVSAEMRRRFYARFVGRTLVCVAETAPDAERFVIARTDNYIPVRVKIPEGLRGNSVLSVRLTGIVDGNVEGEARVPREIRGAPTEE